MWSLPHNLLVGLLCWLVFVTSVAVVLEGVLVFIFVVAIFVLPSMLLGFWLGQRARVARMQVIGHIAADEDGYPVARWRKVVVPLYAVLYVKDDDG